MHTRRDFPKAVYTSVVFQSVIYGSVALVGYYLMGGGAIYINTYVNACYSSDIKTYAGNVMLVLHVMSGYVINANVLSNAINRLWVPIEDQNRRVIWFFITLTTVLVVFVVANMIPTLSDMIGILATTFGYTLTFIFPAIFALKIFSREATSSDKALHYFVLIGCSVAICLGTYATVVQLIKDLDGVSFFSCHLQDTNVTCGELTPNNTLTTTFIPPMLTTHHSINTTTTSIITSST